MQFKNVIRSYGARVAVGAAAVGLLTAGIAGPAVGQESTGRSVVAAPAAKDARQIGTGPLATVGGVAVSATADSATREIAQASPAAVTATANLCGTGYYLIHAEQVPTPEQRLGTVFMYRKNVAPWNACAMFDNNTASAKWMKLKICPNTVGATCDVDEGLFSQYAGPVRVTDGWCAQTTALMKTSSGASTYLVNRTFRPSCN
ncbi:hypothetical protein OG259_00050 [Streptomyces sp. NBC_00250]|uniref:hypothetical protein n=1 Tax=Streptomyces sp. NBC_00250 TaxID=2903641 RepID=UPI002E281533|nr:hypothetical protein [Streptomyces sp. NBC_00250]